MKKIKEYKEQRKEKNAIRKKKYGFRYAIAVYFLSQIVFLVIIAMNVYSDLGFAPKVHFMLLGIGIFSALAFFLTITRMFTPMDKLIDYIDTMSLGNLGVSPNFHSDSEMKQLVKTIDELRQNIQTAVLEMREAEKKRKQFVARISHDLKTPLTSIIGYVEAIRDGIITSEDKKDEYLKVIHDKAMFLNHLINDLTVFTKQELGEIIISRQIILSNKLIQTYLNTIKTQIEDMGIKIIQQTPFVEAYIEVDPFRMTQIFDNLFSNAIKYTNTYISISTKVSENNLQIIVEDDGEGIPEDLKDSIFDPFFMVNKVKDFREKGGSGLGLAIVKQLTTLQNGNISVETKTGEGSKFIVSLPISLSPR